MNDTKKKSSGIDNLCDSKELLDYLNPHSISVYISLIKTYNFSTLYTTIPHFKLKLRLWNIIDNAFSSQNGKLHYKYIVVKNIRAYFVKDDTDSTQIYT